MQLKGSDVAKHIVSNMSDVSVRAVSYDLRVGWIAIDGKETTDVADIKPHSVAIITSLEIIEVPEGHVGYAFPKTGLCNEGVHVLNTGIIDPGYKGHLSTIALNFHKDAYQMERGDVFLRIVMYKMDGQEPDMRASKLSAEMNIRRLNRTRSKRFPNSFLDVPGQVSKLAKDITGRTTAMFVGILTLFTVIFGAYTFFGPALSQFAPAYRASEDSQMQRLEREVALQHQQIEQLLRRDAASSPAKQKKPNVSGTTMHVSN